MIIIRLIISRYYLLFTLLLIYSLYYSLHLHLHLQLLVTCYTCCGKIENYKTTKRLREKTHGKNIVYKKQNKVFQCVVSYRNSNGLFIEFHISLQVHPFDTEYSNEEWIRTYSLSPLCNNYKKEDKLIQKENKMSCYLLLVIVINYNRDDVIY